MIYHRLDEVVGFVGEDGEFYSVILELLYHLVDSGVGSAVFVGAGGVVVFLGL